MAIIIKSAREIDIMHRAGRIVSEVLRELVERLGVGMTTAELDAIAAHSLKCHGATSSFLGYRGFPAHLCVSINDEVVHGIPGERVVCEGDIVSLDFAASVDGFHSDAALTVGIGKVSEQARTLIEVAEGALDAGVVAARCGAHLGDVSAAIQRFTEDRGFSVVREYVGHGIGRDMHEDPQIPNYGVPGRGPVLKQGMTMALEPMVNAGGWRTKVADNRWTVTTADGSLSAHFEHTIAIIDGEPEILTRCD